MINLLPQSEKKKLENEYRLHLAVVVLCLCFILELLMLLALAPSYLRIAATTSALEAELEQKKAQNPPGGEEAQQQLAAINSEMQLLKLGTATSDTPPSILIKELLAAKPEGISVSAIAYGKSGGTVSLQLSGNATTREDLLAFQRELKNNPHWSDIRYAQSFITKKTDIDFQLTVAVQ